MTFDFSLLDLFVLKLMLYLINFHFNKTDYSSLSSEEVSPWLVSYLLKSPALAFLRSL